MRGREEERGDIGGATADPSRVWVRELHCVDGAGAVRHAQAIVVTQLGRLRPYFRMKERPASQRIRIVRDGASRERGTRCSSHSAPSCSRSQPGKQSLSCTARGLVAPDDSALMAAELVKAGGPFWKVTSVSGQARCGFSAWLDAPDRPARGTY